MTLSILGMTGIKLYLAVLAAVLIVGGGACIILDLGTEPYTLSGDNEDSYDIKYIETGQSTIAFTSNPSGALVSIDGEIYTTPTNDISLDPGSYDFEATLTDYESRIATVSVEDRKAKTINIVFVEVPAIPDETATPTPSPTVPGATPTPDGTPTEDYEIPFAGVDVRVRAASPFQGVDNRGGYDEGAWLAIQGKYLMLTDDNILTLHQTSGYPNGVGDTSIDYSTSVPTTYMEFESEYTWGSDVDFTLTHTGSSSDAMIGSPLSGSFPAPGINVALWQINVVPKQYGFVFDVQKQDDSGPVIKNNIMEPVAIAAATWDLVSLASWDYLQDPVINVYASGTQGGTANEYKLFNWMFWAPATVDQDGNWIGGEASTKVVVDADKVINFDTTGSKTMYIKLIDQERIQTDATGTLPYMNDYKITYTVTTGDIVVTSVEKL